MSINLLDLRHLRVGTKEEIKAITNLRDGQFSLCNENKTLYTFVLDGEKYIIDNEKVLASNASLKSRWVYANINVPFGYSYSFDVTDWEDSEDEYKLTIQDPDKVVQTDKTIIQVYDVLNTLVGVSDISKNNEGLYVLTTCKDPDCRFQGMAVILPTNKI